MTLSRPIRCLSGASAALAMLLSATPRPAAALEQVELRMPLLEYNFTIKLEELSHPDSLFAGTSDLAELNRATDGSIGRRLLELVNAPLPLQTTAVVNQAEGSPLFNQALLLVSSLGGIDGLPRPLDTQQLSVLLEQAATRGPLTMLTVLKTLPGKTASIDLGRALFAVQRLARQQQPADRLLEGMAPAGVDPALSQPGPFTVQRREVLLQVAHRPQPLAVIAISPTQGGSGRLVVISHGLWDGPESFEGWAKHLASHGYTVLLPRHPGSDQGQQQAMLSGKVPPPGPAELRLRPMDVSAVIDGAAAGKLGLPAGIRTDSVAVLGHSWGATTALQLAGAQPSSGRLQKECQNVRDPFRNLSSVLQCSFLNSADQSSQADQRVKAVVAVSPPMSLLFAPGAGGHMNGRVLLVSGSRDWVVPPGPEAIMPMASEAQHVGGGHRLVLATGGDHFNMRASFAEAGGALGGLLLAWVNGAFAAGAGAVPGPSAAPLLPANGWGNATLPLTDVTSQLKRWQP